METEPVSDLVGQALGGEPGAFERLHGRYRPMVRAILLARLPFRDVEDGLQEVFLRAFRRLSSLRDRERFGSWLAAIARNLSLDGRWREPAPISLPDQVVDPASESREAGEVLEVLRSMPEPYRETLSMRLVEGLSGPEIAELTGRTAGSIRVHLHRGMKILRERLQEEGWT